MFPPLYTSEINSVANTLKHAHTDSLFLLHDLSICPLLSTHHLIKPLAFCNHFLIKCESFLKLLAHKFDYFFIFYFKCERGEGP